MTDESSPEAEVGNTTLPLPSPLGTHATAGSQLGVLDPHAAFALFSY